MTVIEERRNSLDAVRAAMPSLKDRMAALAGAGAAEKANAPAKATTTIPVPTTTGAQVRAGFIKRSAGESKLATVMLTRYTILFSDPIFIFYQDEARTVPKGGFEIVRGHRVVHEGTTCSIEPSEGFKARSLRLQASSAEEATEWVASIAAAIAGAFPPAAEPVESATPADPSSPTPSSPASPKKPIDGAPDPMKEKPSGGASPSTKRTLFFWKAKASNDGIAVGGVELGGEGLDSPAKTKSRGRVRDILEHAPPTRMLARASSALRSAGSAILRSFSSAGSLHDDELDIESLSDDEDNAEGRDAVQAASEEVEQAEAAAEAVASIAAEAKVAADRATEAMAEQKRVEKSGGGPGAKAAAKAAKAAAAAAQEAADAVVAARLAEEWAFAKAKAAMKRAEKAEAKLAAKQAKKEAAKLAKKAKRARTKTRKAKREEEEGVVIKK